MTSFDILPVTSTIDIPALSTVYEACSMNSSFARILLSEYGPDEDGRSILNETNANATKEGIKTSDNFVFKAVIPGGHIVGYSLWYIGQNRGKPLPRGEEAVKDTQPMIRADVPAAPATQASTSEGLSVDSEKEARKKRFQEEIRRPMIDAYNQYCGDQKVVYLRRLFILPEYQRKGIGKALMQWGLAKADEEGLLGWLVSSPEGYALYRRSGFEDRLVQHFPPHFDSPPHYAMSRQPQPKA